MKYEEAGVKQVQNAAFVLVAGGLGERLGYNGIKVLQLFFYFIFVIWLCRLITFDGIWSIFQVALPMETTTGTCFLQHYIESILCLSEASCKQTQGCYIFIRIDIKSVCAFKVQQSQ